MYKNRAPYAFSHNNKFYVMQLKISITAIIIAFQVFPFVVEAASMYVIP